MSVRKSTGSVRDNIMFFAMAKNLTDGPSFYLWIAKLWEFDLGLTIKYMRWHRGDFGPEAIDYFNEMLAINGKTRHAL